MWKHSGGPCIAFECVPATTHIDVFILYFYYSIVKSSGAIFDWLILFTAFFMRCTESPHRMQEKKATRLIQSRQRLYAEMERALKWHTTILLFHGNHLFLRLCVCVANAHARNDINTITVKTSIIVIRAILFFSFGSYLFFLSLSGNPCAVLIEIHQKCAAKWVERWSMECEQNGTGIRSLQYVFGT